MHLVRILKRRKKQPRVAVAPVHDAEGRVIADKEARTVLWVQQFSAEFAGTVVDVSQEQAVVLLCDRRAQVNTAEYRSTRTLPTWFSMYACNGR